MIKVSVNGGEQTEHTKAVKAPNNYTPNWKEILTLDINRPTDMIQIKLINAHPQAEENEIVSFDFELAQDENIECDD